MAVAAAPAPVAPGLAGVPRGRMVAGTALFVLGFSVVFALLGLVAGGVSELLRSHSAVITQVLGGVTVVLGLLFFGAFDRFTFAGRIIKPSVMPKAGLAGAPLLGVLFGIGWTPCIGPTLAAVQTLSFSTGTAARGAFLALVYGLGLGIPFLVVAALFERTLGVMAFFKCHARLVARIGGFLLIALGLFEATGTWTAVVDWMHTHWFLAVTLDRVIAIDGDVCDRPPGKSITGASAARLVAVKGYRSWHQSCAARTAKR